MRDQRAYLVRIATRQALSRLRTLNRRRESYVGLWLPEPLLTVPGMAEEVELAGSVLMAILLVLETFTPTERAVFVLREVDTVVTVRIDNGLITGLYAQSRETIAHAPADPPAPLSPEPLGDEHNRRYQTDRLNGAALTYGFAAGCAS